MKNVLATSLEADESRVVPYFSVYYNDSFLLFSTFGYIYHKWMKHMITSGFTLCFFRLITMFIRGAVFSVKTNGICFETDCQPLAEEEADQRKGVKKTNPEGKGIDTTLMYLSWMQSQSRDLTGLPSLSAKG